MVLKKNRKSTKDFKKGNNNNNKVLQAKFQMKALQAKPSWFHLKGWEGGAMSNKHL